MSGKLEEAGKTAQQGILSAYDNDPSRNLLFIDSDKLDMTTLDAVFAENNIEFVIGPLLKSNVQKYIETVTSTLPTLLLNLPKNADLLPHHFTLSMQRENEAQQAATSLKQRNYKYPLVLSFNNSVSRNIAQSFATQWEQVNGSAPDIVYFGSGNQMQDDLKASLDINKSKQRVTEVKRMVKEKLNYQLRNRRDIDMIYLVGSPQQTKLMKPYIDVNISPFAKEIPVYASSLSHSIQEDSSDNRDLYRLVFTEIPLLLESKQQNKELAKISQTLWPQRSDSLQRVFAMGYDSLHLVDKVITMQKHPYIRHLGQTGILMLDKDNILTRSLLWGRYSKDKVHQIAIH